MASFIYLDNNATTQVDPRVKDSMLPFLEESYGNPQSTQYALGRTANHHLEKAREDIASILKCLPEELTFTSGATESINMALKGIFQNYQAKGKHIVTVKTEHKATLLTCRFLEKMGADITYLSVDASGRIDLDELTDSIGKQTIMVCIMAANNETGVLHPIQQIAQICQEKNTLFFCDATQWVGKMPLDLSAIPIDMLGCSAHKFHGPKGIGIFFKRKKAQPIQIPPLIIGGQQEYNLRGGTHNLPAIVGMAKALEIWKEDSAKYGQIEVLRDKMEGKITSQIPHVVINGKDAPRMGNTSNITFKYARGSQIIVAASKIAMSTGSACVTGTRDPSHVLKAMGIEEEDCYCTLRLSLSKWTTEKEVDRAVDLLAAAVTQVRSESPIWPLFQQGLI